MSPFDQIKLELFYTIMLYELPMETDRDALNFLNFSLAIHLKEKTAVIIDFRYDGKAEW